MSRGTPVRVHWWVYAWALAIAPVLYSAGFPPGRHWWAVWFGLAPWCVVLRLGRAPVALSVACASTLLGSYLCTPWLPRAVANYYQQPFFLGMLLFAGVYAATVAPCVVAFTLCYRALARHPSAWLPLLAGAAWAGAEFGRTRLLTGNPFGLFGYTQVGVTPLVQIADVTGVYGVSLLLMAVNAALAELWLARGALATAARAVRGAGTVAVVVVVALAYGVVRLQTWPESNPGGASRIALVQGNLDLGSQWRQEFYGRNLDHYLRLTLGELRDSRPQIVFWPESAMTFFLEAEPVYRAAIGHLLSGSGTQLVAGGPRAAGKRHQRFFNSAFLVAPGGEILASYDKQRLLPFAEYFPFGAIELLRREFARVREFTPGGPARLLPTTVGRAGVVICNEVMFSEIVAARVRDGAEYLVTLTNDSWLADRMYAEAAFDMARLRAVEQKRYLLRVSTSGPSAIVDPLGHVVARTDVDVAATVAGDIRPSAAMTIYARVGDLFGVLCLVWCVAVLGGRRCKLWRSSVAKTGDSVSSLRLDSR